MLVEPLLVELRRLELRRCLTCCAQAHSNQRTAKIDRRPQRHIILGHVYPRESVKTDLMHRV